MDPAIVGGKPPDLIHYAIPEDVLPDLDKAPSLDPELADAGLAF